jgi:hypothetical protein
VRVSRAGTVAVRPGTLVDRQATVAMTRMHRPMLGRLAFPVDDVSRRQIRPPRTRIAEIVVTAADQCNTVKTPRHYRSSRESVVASWLDYSAALLTLAWALKR